MKKVLKWIGIVLGAVIGVLIAAGIGLLLFGNMQFKAVQKDRPLYRISADTSPEGLARGKYLMEQAMDCTQGCHTPENGAPLSGSSEPIDFGPITGVFAVPNLTPDQETGLGSWTDAEIARAIREGVDNEGRALVIMPSYTFRVLSDADTAALIGYLRSLQPLRNEIPELSLNAPGKVLLALGMFGPSPLGEPITSVQTAPPEGTTEYGAYLIGLGGCRDCHMQNLAGGMMPFAEPGSVPAANLTPGGELVGWSEADFIKAVQTGVKPSGKTLSDQMIRYKTSAEDLRTIFAYLKSIPAAQPEQ